MAPIGQALRSLLPFGKKASATHNLPYPSGHVTWLGASKASWTSRGYAALTREAYSKNVIAHRSIKMVAECGATIPLRVSRDNTLLQSSALQTLLAQPNHMQDGISFIENLCGFLQLSGNVYIELVQGADGTPTELHLLRPDRMTVVPGSSGWPIAYDYKIGGRTHRFAVDSVTGRSNILHIKTFNPIDSYDYQIDLSIDTVPHFDPIEKIMNYDAGWVDVNFYVWTGVWTQAGGTSRIYGVGGSSSPDAVLNKVITKIGAGLVARTGGEFAVDVIASAAGGSITSFDKVTFGGATAPVEAVATVDTAGVKFMVVEGEE